MIKLKLSQAKALPFDFEKAVAAFVDAKMAHRFTEGEPAPSAPHAWVEHAVKRVPGGDEKPDDFVADYEIVDDTPPSPTFDQRKQALALQVSAISAGESAKVIPLLKRRFWDMEYQRILAAIMAVPPLAKPSIVARALALGTVETPDEFRVRATAVIEKSAPQDVAFLRAHEDRLEKLRAIHGHAARLEAQIDDLTEQTIDAWKLAAFPGA